MNIGLNELTVRINKAFQMLEACRLCPRNCGINRMKQEQGFCGMDARLMISSFNPHFGEEDVLVGSNGSGTIFFTGCNLGCLYCQNYDISHLKQGDYVTEEGLAKIMLYLESLECHNINLVTPTHFVPQILKALYNAAQNGLNLPIVYNSGGYESTSTLELLEGVVDIYMPDAKYADASIAERYSKASDYPKVLKAALKEMYRQVGDLKINNLGLATKGLLMRHLVLPNDLAGTEKIMAFISQEISPDSYVNIMEQYRPMFKVQTDKQMNRFITTEEYGQAKRIAAKFGLKRGF